MPLFDVPGWSITAQPVTESSTSKQRKRPSGDSHKPQTTEINLQKLVTKLKERPSLDIQRTGAKRTRDPAGFIGDNHKIGKHKRRKSKSIPESVEKRPISVSGILNPVEMDSRPHKHSKKVKLNHPLEPSSSTAALLGKQSLDGTTSGLTAFQQGMKQSLDGARFRLINESLYKTESHEAHRMMKDDPRVFEDYHAGFRHQVQVWPTNPVEHYISALSAYPPKTVIADLGCGDAAIARALIPKGMTVLSFDLVSDGTFVVEADICSNIPLPGSEGSENEKSDGTGHVVDVAVCALSLMGINWPNCLREAWRILKSGGELKIAEVASRFTEPEEFQNLVSSIGFRLKSKDDSNSHFTLFEFKKSPRKRKTDKEWGQILSRGTLLKPCEYKRR